MKIAIQYVNQSTTVNFMTGNLNNLFRHIDTDVLKQAVQPGRRYWALTSLVPTAMEGMWFI